MSKFNAQTVQSMNAKQQLSELELTIADGDVAATLALLKSVGETERFSWSKSIGKLVKHYSEIIALDDTNRRFGARGSQSQLTAVDTAALVCMSYKDIKAVRIADKQVYESVLAWYVPDWLPQRINDAIGKDFISPPFHDIAFCYELIKRIGREDEVKEETWAKILATHPDLQLADRYPTFFFKHIWHMFAYETSICYSHKRIDDQLINWQFIIQQLVDDGRLDRIKVVEAMIKGAVAFNKTPLNNWFAEMISFLLTDKEAILVMQEPLQGMLLSPYSKVVNTSLNLLLSVVHDPSFDDKSCIAAMSMVFNSTVKTVLNEGIKLVTQLVKKDKSKNQECAIVLLAGFSMQDQTMQKKLAKLLIKLVTPSQPIKEGLHPYHSLLLSDTKALLKDYIVELQEVGLPEKGIEEDSEDRFINPIDNAEDLVFYLTSAWGSATIYTFEYAVDAILHFIPTMQQEDFDKLLPVFDKAYKVIGNIWSASHRDMLLGMWLIEWSRLLRQDSRFKIEALEKIYQKHLKSNKLGDNFGFTLETISLVSEGNMRHFYVNVRLWLPIYYHSLKMVTEGVYYPVLCVPSIEPFYLDAKALIKRLALYQKGGYLFDSIDLQLAISRLYVKDLQDKTEAIALAKEVLNEDCLALIRYVLGSTTQIKGSKELIDVWRYAASIRFPETFEETLGGDDYTEQEYLYCTSWSKSWDSIDEPYTYTAWDAKSKEMKPKTVYNKKIVIQPLSLSVDSSVIFSRINQAFDVSGVGHSFKSTNLMALLSYQLAEQRYSVDGDLIAYTPRNIDVVLVKVIQQALSYGGSSTYEVAEKKLLQGLLVNILQFKSIQHTEAYYLFLALALITEDRVSRALAAELWIKEVADLDQKVLGIYLAKIQRNEFANLKRLTDTIQNTFIHISQQHTTALQVMLESMIAHMGHEPIKGFKTILEQYFEIINKQGSALTDDGVIEKLSSWSSVTATKKIIKSLLALKK